MGADLWLLRKRCSHFLWGGSWGMVGMKKSRQVWTDSWGAWTSSMGGSFAAVGMAMLRSIVMGPGVGLRMSV
jgi:hypothetical protein